MESQNVLNGGHSVPKLTTRMLTLMALMLAIRIVLANLPSIDLGFARMGIAFLGNAMSGVLFGPVYAFILAIINDIVSFFLSGGGIFFPGYMFSEGLAGWFYAALLWRKPKTWLRIFIAVLLVTVICNLLLGTLWLSMIQGKAWMALIVPRLGKNAISLVLNTILIKLLVSAPPVARLIKKYEF